jgi:predicted TIM-barrel fold metal-dependent hydrolase
MPIDLTKITAIDVHVHAEVSCHDPEDPVMGQFFDAASSYFKAPREPKMPEIAQIYREQNIAFCLFTVDCEAGIGAKRVSNYEIAEFAAKNDDVCIPFASIDPHKGKYGAREARDLIENHGVKGFKFHHICQNIHPAEQVGYAIYEVINHYKLPAIFHTGHSGMGTGMRGGGGIRLKYGQPMLVDDVAVDFPDMKIILAHPRGRGWMKACRWRCTRTTSTSIFPAGAPSISSRRSSSMPTPSSRRRCCSAAIFR